MATNVKKITKTIGGTEYGLQVESAIRDGDGKIIKDTYALKTELPTIPNLEKEETGTGNVVTAIDVSGHKITYTKGITALTAETQLSKGTTTGAGNVVTDISVNGHEITLNKGITALTEHQDISGKADKTATVSSVDYDATNKKITKTINGTTSDVVTAATIVVDGGGITSETQLSKEQSGTGNVVTDIAVSGHKITYTMGNVDLSSKQDKFDDGSATVATVANNIISIQPEVAQTNGAITTGNAAVIQTYDKDHIDELVKGPASAIDDNIAVFDGTTGKVIKDGGKSITAIVEIAEGKTASYVIAKESDITGTKGTSGDYTNVTTITGVDITKLKIGDIILVTELTSPDFWVSAVNKTGETITSVSLSRMETAKVDISGKADKLTDAGSAEISSLNAETGVATIHREIGQATTLAISTESAHANDITVYSKAKSDELFETKFNYSDDLSWTY